MNETQACSILRITAIATILVGTIQSAQSAITWFMFEMPVGPSIYVSEEDFLRPLRFGFYEDLVVPICGFFVLAFSTGLARYVARGSAAQLDAGADGPSGRSSAS